MGEDGSQLTWREGVMVSFLTPKLKDPSRAYVKLSYSPLPSKDAYLSEEEMKTVQYFTGKVWEHLEKSISWQLDSSWKSVKGVYKSFIKLQ